jgi:hypothetical protein
MDSGDPSARRSPVLRSFALEREVERLLSEGRNELAVLISQTLLELRTEAELAHFVKTSQEPSMGEAALAALGTYNLANPRVQRFVETIVGVRFRDRSREDFAALKSHVERRNGIAHRREQVGAEDARASFAAVLKMTETLHELCYLALGLDDELEEERRQQREADGYYDDADDFE